MSEQVSAQSIVLRAKEELRKCESEQERAKREFAGKVLGCTLGDPQEITRYGELEARLVRDAGSFALCDGAPTIEA